MTTKFRIKHHRRGPAHHVYPARRGIGHKTYVPGHSCMMKGRKHIYRTHGNGKYQKCIHCASTRHHPR